MLTHLQDGVDTQLVELPSRWTFLEQEKWSRYMYTAPSLHHHCTITAPSLHHHCTITAPSLHHHHHITAPSLQLKFVSTPMIRFKSSAAHMLSNELLVIMVIMSIYI